MDPTSAISDITIFVSMSEGSISKLDKDETCMKAIIASYAIIVKPSDWNLLESKVVLHLRELNATVHYKEETNVSFGNKYDRKVDVVALAAESVLKRLDQADCVGKAVVAFQWNYGHDSSPLCNLLLRPNTSSLSVLESISNMNQGIISHAYAYLNKREICLFLRDTSQETVEKIDQALAELFPRKS